MVFSAIIIFAPEGGGYFLETPNFYPADPLKTRRTLRRSGTSRRSTRSCAPSCGRCSGIDAKFWGVVAMGAGRHLRLPAVAGPQPGQVDPLPRSDLQDLS